MSNEQKIWSFLMGKIGNAYGVAGLMGNLNAESALNPNEPLTDRRITTNMPASSARPL